MITAEKARKMTGIDRDWTKWTLRRIENDIRHAIRNNQHSVFIFDDFNWKHNSKNYKHIVDILEKNGFEIKKEKGVRDYWSCNW